MARVRLARDRHRRARPGGHSRGPGRSAADHRPADDDRGAHAEGQGREARRRQGGLARQAVQEGPGGRSGHCRARSANDVDRAIPPPVIPEAGPAADRGPAARLRRRSARRRRTQPGDSVATREAFGAGARRARQPRSTRRRARRRRQELDLHREVREGLSRSLLPDLHRRAGDGRHRDGPREPRRDSVPVDVRVLSRSARPTSSAWPASPT